MAAQGAVDDEPVDLVYGVIELVVEALSGLPLWACIVVTLSVAVPLTLWHEAGHAVAALALSRGPVEVSLGGDVRPLWLEIGRRRVELGLSPFGVGRCT